jgi:hypothetical protein
MEKGGYESNRVYLKVTRHSSDIKAVRKSQWNIIADDDNIHEHLPILYYRYPSLTLLCCNLEIMHPNARESSK